MELKKGFEPREMGSQALTLPGTLLVKFKSSWISEYLVIVSK